MRVAPPRHPPPKRLPRLHEALGAMRVATGELQQRANSSPGRLGNHPPPPPRGAIWRPGRLRS
eukprot:11196303-Lingulodinium_polyedra.AAC.1